MGPCCSCGFPAAENLVMLPWRARQPGKGWGCVVCGLPSDGAVALLCDRCLEVDAPIISVCAGYATEPGRVPFASLTEPHVHDLSKHREDD